MYKRRYDLLRSKFNEFFLPTLFTSMANNICLFADSLIVSFLIGAINLSAIQLVYPIVNLINLLYWMIGLGGSVLVSVSKAEYDEEKSNSFFTVSMVSLIVIGIFITIFGLLFFDNIVNFLCSTPDIKPLVKSFFMVLILGMPFLCYMMGLSYFIRLDGNPNLSFKAILLSNIINIILDFIYVGFLGLGIGGAALATVTGYVVGSIYISQYFFSKDRTLKFINKSKVKILSLLKQFKEICVSGFPSSSTQLFLMIKLLAINALISIVLGASGLIAFSVCNSVSFIIYMFLIGTSQTMSPIVSVYNQEEDYSGVHYTMKRSIKLTLISSVVIAGIFILFPQAIVLLYSVRNPTDVIAVTDALRLYSLSFIGLAVTFLMMFYAQAIKKNTFSLIISLIEGLLVPVLGAYLLVPFIGANGIWIAFIIAEVLAILFIFIYSKHVERKSNGEYFGFFMIKKQDQANVLDLSCSGDIEEIINLTNDVESYLKSMDMPDFTSMRVSLAIEEMLVHIVELNNNIKTIDILIKIKKDKILIAVKDQGIIFDPTLIQDDWENLNIKFLNDIADEIDYTRVLGLNSTVITISRTNFF